MQGGISTRPAIPFDQLKVNKMDDLEFPRIYEVFHSKILRYMVGLVGEAEAEDLTQEIFMKVSAALPNFRGDSQPSTWIYRIATNAALDRMRSPSYRPATLKCDLRNEYEDNEPEVEDQNAWTGEKTPLIEQQIFHKEMNECIKGFINRLPESYRTVLVLSEFEGLKNNEIADILGVSAGMVKIRLHRARQRLKKELKANCDSYWVEDNEFIPELKII